MRNSRNFQLCKHFVLQEKRWTQCVVLPHSSIFFHQQPNLEVLSVYIVRHYQLESADCIGLLQKNNMFTVYIYKPCAPYLIYYTHRLFCMLDSPLKKEPFQLLGTEKKNDYSDSIQHWRDLVSSLLHLEFNEASTLAKGLANASSMIPETATIREEPPLAEAVKSPPQAWAGNGWLFQDSRIQFF